jgi:TonB family protein
VIPGSHLLEKFWLAMAAHLWQTTLVLAILFLLGWAMRRASGRLVNLLWGVGLLKVFLPLPVLGPLGDWTLRPILGEIIVSGDRTGTLVVWLERAAPILDPTVVVAGMQPGSLTSWNVFLTVLTVLWLFGVVWVGRRFLRREIRQARDPGFTDCEASQEAIRARLDLALAGTRVPSKSIRISGRGSVPAVAGLLHPKILIPDRLVRELNPEELRAILLHEDAHRRRYDPLRAVIQRAALSLFFFYPLIWPLVNRVSESAEIACDEAAMRSGVHSSLYTRALARTLKMGLAPAATPAAVNPKRSSLIRRRFDRLEEPGEYMELRRHRVLLVLAILCVVCLSFIPLSRLARAGDQDPVSLPTILHESYVLPEYPEEARLKGLDGEVLLEVRVLADGTVDRVTVKEDVPGFPFFGKNAVEAVRQWRFEPATRSGKPVETTVDVPIHFRLGDEKAAKAATSPEGSASARRPVIEYPDGLALPEIIPASCPRPEYPEVAREAGLQGEVLLDIRVAVDGSVADVVVQDGVRAHPALVESAIKTVQDWILKPAERDGEPVEFWVTVPIVFNLDD